MDLGVDRPVPAVVAIDLHRGHLDPAVATMPLAPDRAARVVAANARFFKSCRADGIPVVHLLTQYRDAAEIASMPAWLARSRNYAVVVIEDCVDTMDGPALHEAALACIRTAFGHVMRSDEIQKLQGLK